MFSPKPSLKETLKYASLKGNLKTSLKGILKGTLGAVLRAFLRRFAPVAVGTPGRRSLLPGAVLPVILSMPIRVVSLSRSPKSKKGSKRDPNLENCPYSCNVHMGVSENRGP